MIIMEICEVIYNKMKEVEVFAVKQCELCIALNY